MPFHMPFEGVGVFENFVADFAGTVLIPVHLFLVVDKHLHRLPTEFAKLVLSVACISLEGFMLYPPGGDKSGINES